MYRNTDMSTHAKETARMSIAAKVRRLRNDRHWTQAELSERLGLSQSRLSEIERGQGSFTAEQFLAILKLFNVSVTHFAAGRRPSAELQNALARLGAAHLQENPDVLPSEVFDQVADVVREVLFTAESPRHVTSLAPVLVHNIDRISFKKLRAQFIEAGLQRRLGWLFENTLGAIRHELSQNLPRSWTQRYRRAEVVIGALPTLQLPPRGDAAGTPDILDPDILSTKTLEEVNKQRSSISRRWGIATDLHPEDFAEALKAARAADR
jgi:transcriptional regulator with XRE-family HTH domain